MSWTDTILSNTIGVLYSARTGQVDPWTLANEQEQVAADTKQALGPDASDADVAIAITQAQNEVSDYLKSVNASPDQACLIRFPWESGTKPCALQTPSDILPALEKVVYALIAIGALVGAFYFYQQYSSIVKQTFRKK